MKIERRKFIRNSIITGVGASLDPLAALAHASAPMPIKRIQAKRTKSIIVAGAGITGLCCAYELVQQGHQVTVLEASGRHGGHVYTGRDGLSEGLYTDYGADHITLPGYERFFGYLGEFGLKAIYYPHAEGSDAAPERKGLTMIDGRFYTDAQLRDPAVLRSFGFHKKEVELLSKNPWYALKSMYLDHYMEAFKDPYQPYGVGYDDLDNVSIYDVFKKEGASEAALNYLGGKNTSALYALWRMYVEKSRGIPLNQGDTYRLEGGNQQLPTAFAKHLGKRVRLNHPIKAIQQDETGVTVTYTAYGYEEEKQLKADLFVNCISLPIFRKIPVTPALSAEKQYVVDNLAYSSHPFYVFEASSRFWLDDGLESINMSFEHPDISMIWEETNHVATDRVLLKAYGPGGLSPLRVLDSFRSLYPGKKDTIYQALTHDWTKDRFAPTCEMQAFPVGGMRKFWPQIMQCEGKIYFAGTYADNLSRGMESCIRSAQRVAKEISEL